MLTIELDRPHPNYFIRWAVQPRWIADLSKQPGDTYQMSRYGLWGDTNDLTQASRRRLPEQLIGTDAQRIIPVTKSLITINEYTGPSAGDPQNPSKPGHLLLDRYTILTSQRYYWDLLDFDPIAQPVFHESIGAITLLDDFRRWVDRVYLELLSQTPYKWNPGGQVQDGGTYDQGPPKISTDVDLNGIYESLASRNAKQFDDGLYYAIVSLRMLKHLQQDQRFNEMVLSSAYFIPISAIQTPSQPFSPGLMIPSPQSTGGILQSPNYQQGLMPPANNPNMPNYMAFPNQLGFLGMGVGQTTYGSRDLMPAGLIFRGFRIFSSNNLFTKKVNLTYTAVPSGYNSSLYPTGQALRTAYLGYFYGPQAVGEVMASGDASGFPVSIKKSLNTDFDRFLPLIWQMYAGFTLLEPDRVVEVRTYGP